MKIHQIYRDAMWVGMFGVGVLAVVVCFSVGEVRGDNLFDRFTDDWRNDPIWFDGQAEYAVYDATRMIYGQSRQYQARMITNKEHASANTFTKSSNNRGRSVFKFHMRDEVPTQNYMYHFSTMVYVGTDDLKSLKIDMGSQEDCGSTFKQIINHQGKMGWEQSSYFPDEGRDAGALTNPPTNMVFADALPLVLRGYPFPPPTPPHSPTHSPPHTTHPHSPADIIDAGDVSHAQGVEPMALQVLADTTHTHLTSMDLELWMLRYVGHELLDLPIGEVHAHHLELRYAGPTKEIRPTVNMWFDADPTSGHRMVQMIGTPGGDGWQQTYQLRSVKRWAYWER